MTLRQEVSMRRERPSILDIPRGRDDLDGKGYPILECGIVLACLVEFYKPHLPIMFSWPLV